MQLQKKLHRVTGALNISKVENGFSQRIYKCTISVQCLEVFVLIGECHQSTVQRHHNIPANNLTLYICS